MYSPVRKGKPADSVQLSSSYFKRLQIFLAVTTVTLILILVAIVILGIFILLEKPKMEKVIVEIDRMSSMSDELAAAVAHRRNHSNSIVHKSFSIIEIVHRVMYTLQHNFNDSQLLSVADFVIQASINGESSLADLYDSINYLIELQKIIAHHLDTQVIIRWIDSLQAIEPEQLTEVVDAIQYVGNAAKKIDMEALLSGSKQMTDTIDYFKRTLQHANIPNMVDRAAHVADIVDSIDSSLNTTEINLLIQRSNRLLAYLNSMQSELNVTAISSDTLQLLKQLDSLKQQLQGLQTMKIITSIVSS